MTEPDPQAPQEPEAEEQRPEPAPEQARPRRSSANPQARSRPRAVASEATGDALAVTEAVEEPGAEPLYLYEPRSGLAYQVTSAAERTRLLMRGYRDTPPYDPSGKGVEEVNAYIAEHPGEAAAIRSRERAGKARVTITGDPSE